MKNNNYWIKQGFNLLKNIIFPKIFWLRKCCWEECGLKELSVGDNQITLLSFEKVLLLTHKPFILSLKSGYNN